MDRRVLGVLVDLEVDEPGFLAELLTEFEEGAARRVNQIREAVRAGDTQALMFAAHTLRGSCGVIGARRMATLAGELEDAPPTSPEAGQSLTDRLEMEYDAVRRALADVGTTGWTASTTASTTRT